jgi:hypothetical protein
MEATQKSDATSPTGDVIARLRVDEYDRLAAAKGAKSVVAAAGLHNMPRTVLFEYRAGRRTPRLDVAMRMAADLGVPVEKIFELRRAA